MYQIGKLLLLTIIGSVVAKSSENKTIALAAFIVVIVNDCLPQSLPPSEDKFVYPTSGL